MLRRFAWFGLGGLALAIPGLSLIPMGWALRAMAAASQRAPLPRPSLQASALLADLRLGGIGLLGSLGLMAPSGLCFYGAWTLGWNLSFEAASASNVLLLALGPVLALIGSGLLAAAFAYLPVAQVHFARTGRLRSMYGFRELREIRRRDPYGWWRATLVIPVYSFVHGIGRAALPLGGADLTASVLFDLVLNVVLLAFFIAVKLRWARRYARGLERTAADRRVDRWLLPPAYLLVALVTVVIGGFMHFLAAHGPTDFFAIPLVTIPTVPYPGGIPLR